MNRFALSLTALALAFGRAFASDSVVVFNEINYHPASDEGASEWIELHNQMAIDIDLSAWQIEDGVNYTFAEGTVVPAGGYLVVAGNPAAVQAATGLITVLGPWIGGMDNGGETLTLRDRNQRLMDRVGFGDGGKWPVAPDGSGATLAKRNPNSISADPANWTSSVAVGGTPGRRNFPESSAGLVSSLIPLGGVWRFDASGTDRGTSWREPGFDDSSWGGQNGATLISYWPFNGTAAAGPGTNGTLISGVTATADRNGLAGGALAFNGTSQYVSVAGGGGLSGATAGTISMWAQWADGPQDADCCGTFGAVMGRQSNGVFSNNVLSLSTADPATAKLVWRQTTSGPALITGTTAVGSGWHHIAVTFSPTGTTVYLDGVAEGSAVGGALNTSTTVALAIGAWSSGGGGFMKGSLDDVAIWDQPLGAAQIAELAASTKAPLNFSGPESAVYFSGDGRLTSNDSLRKTTLPTGPTTYYFRRAFPFSEDIGRTALKLDLAADDGAVVYLNGTEIYRHNMPAGAVGYSTFAASAVGDTPLLAGLPIPTTSLVAGTNVVAAEVHQAAAGDPGMVFGVGLNAVVTPLGVEALVPDALVFNELSAAGETPFRVELINRGAAVVDTAGFVIRRTGDSPDADFPLPPQLLAPGAFLVIGEESPGFGAVASDRLFLFRPGQAAVADAVEVHDRRRARSPDGTGEFLTPDGATFGAGNVVTRNGDVVINEIMYHAPPTLEVPASGGNPAIPFSPSPEQWVELFNRSGQPVDLTGWRLDEVIDFRFAPNTVIAPGGYLVIAKDPVALQAKFPGLVALGPFANKLSRTGGSLLLRDANDNPANRVPYFDDGRWPEAADAGGSSLELRDPRSDNAAGESWAASDETHRSAWQTYTYTDTAKASSVGPDTQWKEFVIGLLDKGEVLLDDISVIEAPATAPVQMLQNGSFTTDASKWRIIGNHHGSVIDDPDQPGNKVLRLVATGSTDHMSNHGETTLAGNRSVGNGKIYQISFRAKWISGCRQLNTRLYFNRLARTTLLEGHSQYGTPGAVNTAFTANLGPTYAALRHEPAVPAASVPVTVSVAAADPDGLASMTLWSRVDGGAWASQAMTGDGASSPRFSAVLPGQAAGTVVQFYVEGADSLGVKSTFPAAGAGSRVLYKVNDGLAKTNGLHNVRLVTLKADADELHKTINLMSNERIGATLIYDEREVFYDVGLRLKGSEHSRTETLRLGFNVGFYSEQLFRGIHRSVAIDRSESTGFGQREMLFHQMVNHAGGVPTKYHDLIQLIAPRAAHTGSAELQLARYTNVFLDDQYDNGSDGMVFEYELVYQLNSTDNGSPEGNKVPAPDSVVGTAIRNLGDDKEGYRWTFLIKNNEDRDDYSRIIPFSKWMATSGTAFTSKLTTYLDVDQWLRGTAVNVLTGMGDSYGGDGSQHNVQFYARPSDGRMLFFPHDMDAFFDAGRSIVPSGDFGKIVALPGYARDYYGHLLDIIKTTYNSAYLGRWATQFGTLLPGQPFASHLAAVTQRATNVTNQVKTAIPVTTPFAITTNGGNDVSIAEDTVTLTGTAPLIMGTTVPLVVVRSIMINGVIYPVTWTSKTAWTTVVPLRNGANVLTVQGVDPYGVPVGAALDAITVTTTGAGAPQPVRINEWMASNSGPDGFADPVDGLFQDWIELFNPNLAEVNLGGSYLTDTLAVPTKWQIPAGVVIAPRGYLVVWADNQPAQNGINADLHAGFQLNGDGESIGLFNAAGVAQHTVSFGPQEENVSLGLFPDGDPGLPQVMRNWTPGAANTLASPLRFTAIAHEAGVVTVTWDAIPGRTYRVEFKNSPTDPAWTPLGPDVVAGGPSAGATDIRGANPQRFYRVRRLD